MVDCSNTQVVANSRICIAEHDKGYTDNVKKLFLVLALVLSLVTPLTARPGPIQTTVNFRGVGPLTRIAAGRAALPTPPSDIASKVLANGLEVIVLGSFSSYRYDRTGGAQRIVHRTARAEWLVAPVRTHVL